MPPYTAVTTTLYQMPTGNKYVIQINKHLPLQGGLALNPLEVAATVRERLSTWLNPMSCEIEIRLDEASRMAIHRP
eukprot:6173774-Karenia_brevis.AAC.1